jgi:hypothetical protein
MEIIPFPPQVIEILFQDALSRDRASRRRACLCKILWQERYLRREQLIARVEAELGTGCFGERAWKDNFYRDLRVVKQAFQAAGFQLIYRRGTGQSGYGFAGKPMIGDQLAKILEGSVAEVDPAQIAIFREMTIAQRFRLGCSVSDTSRKAVVYRIQHKNPQLSLAEANRIALSQGRER